MNVLNSTLVVGAFNGAPVPVTNLDDSATGNDMTPIVPSSTQVSLGPAATQSREENNGAPAVSSMPPINLSSITSSQVAQSSDASSLNYGGLSTLLANPNVSAYEKIQNL